MIIITFVILLAYSLLIISFIIGFVKVKEFKPKNNWKPVTKFSIIIPFRNETENLTPLLNSLALLEYPRDYFEIIMIDDDSSDNSVELIQQYSQMHQGKENNISIIKNIRTSNSPKKDAINTAILQAQFDWVITTDADCIVPSKWLNTFDAFIQINRPKLIAAPVKYTIDSSFLEQFQSLEFLSLQASTIGGFGIGKPFLCNGANFCYIKKTFLDVKGFTGNENLASGDDIFLLEKITKQYPDKVHFLKSYDVLVRTKPQSTFKALTAQRIRWAAKSTSYKNNFTKLVGLLVFSMNSWLVIALLMLIFNQFIWYWLLITFCVKLILDGILTGQFHSFSKQNFNIFSFIISSLYYPFFSMFVALASFKNNFVWKGRQFKK